MTFAKTLRQVRELTATNDHGGALLTTAKALGCDDLVVHLEAIQRQRLHLGHLPQNLYDERHGIYKNLLAVAQDKLGEADYQRLYAAF